MSAAHWVLDPAHASTAPAWLSGEGPDGDVVISSRVRLARNLAEMPFASRSGTEHRARVLDLARDYLMAAPVLEGPGQLSWLDVHRLLPLDRTLLVERHLISKEHARGPQVGEASEGGGGSGGVAGGGGGTGGAVAPGTVSSVGSSSSEPRGLAVAGPDGSIAIMVNEEDHLRLQVMRGGFNLDAAWRAVDELDDRLESGLDFAYSTRFGYLTACPTNVGCACRMSVMVHLPGLALMGELERVRRSARDMALAVRGYYGEGSEAVGELFQISNQTTLGKSEADILRELEQEIIPDVIRAERTARQQLLERRRRHVEDQVYRALATLQSARLLAPDEAISLLSRVRLGVLSGLLAGVDERAVSLLFLLTQPAHLQKIARAELDQQQRREFRADLVRARLAGAMAPRGE